MRMTIKKNLIFYFILFLILAIPLTNNQYFYYYAFILLFFMALFYTNSYKSLKYVQNADRQNSKEWIIKYYPAVLLCTWWFGIIVGLLRGNQIENIVQNFAGTLCYLLYYVFLYKKIDKDAIISSIIKASVLATLFTACAYLLTIANNAFWPFSNVTYNVHTKSVITSVEPLAFILLTTSIWGIFVLNNSIWKKLTLSILFLLASWVLLATNNMGGYKLGYVIVLGISIYYALFFNAGYSKTAKLLGTLCFIAAIATIIILDFTSSQSIANIFSLNDAGNEKRYYQINIVFDRFKILGNGIGAVYEYSILGKTYSGYGIEVSYLNIIDKYGILSAGILYVFAKTLIIPMRYLGKTNENGLRNMLAIGSCGYFFVAIGNPILFSAYNVILHCIVLYLLTGIRYKRN
ncbi:MAG: hypothetical protein KO464_02760 [Candidatus Methanofastidiosum sp.]|nr:hypothetical protein [Methanofastidiosum sp.]